MSKKTEANRRRLALQRKFVKSRTDGVPTLPLVHVADLVRKCQKETTGQARDEHIVLIGGNEQEGQEWQIESVNEGDCISEVWMDRVRGRERRKGEGQHRKARGVRRPQGGRGEKPVGTS
eukprot:574511-Hanusia_phi.AAC.3